MEFANNRPIYRQIVEYAFARILDGQWMPDSRVPSVRELATSMAVNSHTVLKAYDELQRLGIISPRRGMGFFLEPDARRKILEEERREFFDVTLRSLFDRMDSLGIGVEDVVQCYLARNNG
ncbi:MAG: GntR family transcriptional regulator [Muribaculaceae bacterium]|nr:GntR family transcriptional regulator [Muribaculaceae bacterium]